MKSSNIGGQAVMEGIMMRHGDRYSVAVRKPDQEIEVKVEPYKGFIKSRTLMKIPVIRGVFGFIDSLVVGTRTLMYSASFFDEEEETQENLSEEEQRRRQEKSARAQQGLMYGSVIFAVLLAVGLFMLLPYYAAQLLIRFTGVGTLAALAESVLRLLIFAAYLLVISRMKDIRRTFEYHGAEHKCINCIEHGMELNVENVLKSSREHKRCGTSFLFFVVIVSAVLLMFIRVDSHLLRVVLRILLMPVIAGISYEIIRYAGRHDNAVVNILSKPGLYFQRLTTREPDEQEAEVAIAAVEAVFDWKSYLAENFGYEEEAGNEKTEAF